eukprot:GHVT01020327.1.p1 GENE.GHVT01020327.1~~GHVT01020327.1.p1  ORF type:complete len:148 (+),score=7.31 GHVT01020327.1:358-801(+)
MKREMEENYRRRCGLPEGSIEGSIEVSIDVSTEVSTEVSTMRSALREMPTKMPPKVPPLERAREEVKRMKGEMEDNYRMRFELREVETDGEYEVLEKLGEGGFGIVEKVRDRSGNLFARTTMRFRNGDAVNIILSEVVVRMKVTVKQ